jgi:glycosyltransferase involved in cell wall biosynthesis
VTSVGALLVTHNSQRWIESTLNSIRDQSRPADRVLIVDDNSNDDTVRIIRDALGFLPEIIASESTAESRTDRIAQNFRQGVLALQDVDILILGDHDDVWHADRIAHQVGFFDRDPRAVMLASDGRLVDADGEPTGGTLRSVFPVPDDFNEMKPAQRMRTCLRYSTATGGASAIRAISFRDVDIPAGWLHDRWWSLVATARDRMLVDDEVVIDYRVTDHQEVGLDRGTQDASGATRAARATSGDAAGAFRKLKDLQAQLAPYATIETRSELHTMRLVRNLLQKG